MARFSQIPRVNLPRSTFDLSHGLKTTFNEGKLVPVYCAEVVPGDSFNCDVSSFCRLASPLSVPIMDNLYLDFHFFFVPYRLVWDNFVKLMGERVNPNDSIDYLVPNYTTPPEGVASQSLFDYFNVPIKVGALSFSVLPMRAYWLIWNDWFRDENLQDSAPIETGDVGNVWKAGQNVINEDMTFDGLAPRAKKHDYFTSSQPWPQKGPGVKLPIGTSAPVFGDGNAMLVSNTLTGSSGLIGWGPKNLGHLISTGANGSNVSNISAKGEIDLNAFGQNVPVGLATKEAVDSYPALNSTGLYADLSEASAATINMLRQAFMIQSLLELDARGGTRYNEIILAHFGVVSPDARLQRPEFLGGFRQNIVINTVVQQSATDDVTPQGNLAAYGVAAASKHGFTKSFVEHGLIIGLASVRSELTYQQGLPRWMSRRTRYDFYDPIFAHLGEQAILNKEIYAQGNDVRDDSGDVIDEQVFGYQEHWSELRFEHNKVTGLFRSTADLSLDVFHLAQKFDSLPALNSTFIAENAPMDRVVAVPDQPDFLLDVWFNQRAARPMPVYSTPAKIARF